MSPPPLSQKRYGQVVGSDQLIMFQYGHSEHLSMTFVLGGRFNVDERPDQAGRWKADAMLR